MPKPASSTGQKNLVSKTIVELRKQQGYSQHDLASKLQLLGFDMDKNAITRIENNKRYVTDLELLAFTKVFNVSYEYLIDETETD